MKKLFGLDFYLGKIDGLIDEIELINKNNKRISIFTPNVDHIINNFNNEIVMNRYKKSEYIIADGWPLVLVARLKKINISRITGVDLMDKLFQLANTNKYRIYFLGGTEETLNKLKSNLMNKYPFIQFIGTNNGYFNDDKKIIEDINKNNINILFVGMGNPKQELWIRENISILNINVAVGVGGAFKIFSNEVERAPKFIQKIGMEWFYRFLKEPKRLFSRYFIKYPQFTKYFLKELCDKNE